MNEYETWWNGRPASWRLWQRVRWWTESVACALVGRKTPGERLALLMAQRMKDERDAR